MLPWIGNEAEELRDGSPFHIRHHSRHSAWRAFVLGFMVATCGIALSQALAGVPGWIAPAVGAALAAIALVVL